MTGSTPFLIEKSDNFQRSLKKLVKAHGKRFTQIIIETLENLTENPYPHNSRQEPLPGKLRLSQDLTFHKLELRISKGASGQIRLMYLVNNSDRIIKLVWIYSHEQFTKRPADRDLQAVIKEILDC
ncbi:MAG: type II toxin-antitoxin system RelE/ParE family toxin [Waterburya sp.]